MTGPTPDEDVTLVPGDPAIPNEPVRGPEQEPVNPDPEEDGDPNDTDSDDDE